MTRFKVPSFIEFPSDFGGVNSCNGIDMDYDADENGFQEAFEGEENNEPTPQDLQAMKQMIHDLAASPELLYELSPGYARSFLSTNSCERLRPVMDANRRSYCESCKCSSDHRDEGTSRTKLKRRSVYSSPPALVQRQRIAPTVLTKLPRMPFQVCGITSADISSNDAAGEDSSHDVYFC